MQKYSSLKQEFLKKWINGMGICSSEKQNMGLMERKNAIKLSADLAMASARKGKTRWSRAIIAKALQNGSSNNITDTMLTSSKPTNIGPGRTVQSKKIVRRSRALLLARRNVNNGGRRKGMASRSIAKRLVEKRTKKLKRLVPGGELIEDDACLIEETLDYLVFLRAQVDFMRFSYTHLFNAK